MGISGNGTSLEAQVRQQLELAAKYDGYLQIQSKVASRAQALEDLRIPDGLDFQGMAGLSFETIEKLGRIRPATVGQASRVPGVRPSDIALLIGHLRGGRHRRDVKSDGKAAVGAAETSV